VANVLAPAADPLEGREIAGGKYKLEKYRSSDDLGRLYLARHMKLDRTVIIRMLHGSHLSDEHLVTRFNRAGLAASRVRHPNVVDVVDLGEEPDGSLYLVSEYIEGRNLAELVAEDGPFAAHRVVDIIAQVSSAVQMAHSHGVIHRDLKPEIVQIVVRESDDGMLTEVVKVLDFGVAKLESPMGGGEQPRHMTIEMISGRPEYMSPEQCNGMQLDARSDLYAIGCLAYFLSTGQPPFSGGGLLEVLMKQVKEQPAPPSQLAPQISASLEAVILKLLSKRPGDRFQTARELRAALSRLEVPRPRGGESFDIDMSGSETIEVSSPSSPPDAFDSASTPSEVRSPPSWEREKKTHMMERPAPITRRRTSAASKMMIAAVIIAIAIGVGAGLLFGQMYEPDSGAETTGP
jgi:serine/threonine-protein kinase